MAPSPPQRTGTNNRLGAATRRAQFCRLYASSQLIAPRPCSETPGASRRKHAQFPLASAASRSGSDLSTKPKALQRVPKGRASASSTPWTVVRSCQLPLSYSYRRAAARVRPVRPRYGASVPGTDGAIRTVPRPVSLRLTITNQAGRGGIWRTWGVRGLQFTAVPCAVGIPTVMHLP